MSQRHLPRRLSDATLALLVIGAWLWFVFGGEAGGRRPADGFIGLPASFWALGTMLGLLICRLTLELSKTMVPPCQFLSRLAEERATASAGFVLLFTLYLLIVGMIVQMALLGHAAVVVKAASYSAARAAVTALPEGEPQRVERAAHLTLMPISPVVQGAASEQGEAVGEALQGIWPAAGWGGGRQRRPVDQRMPLRYTFAERATSVRIDPPPQRFVRLGAHAASPQQVTVEVEYRFQLTVPGAAGVLRPNAEAVGGVPGRYMNMTASTSLHTAPGRSYTPDLGVLDGIGSGVGLW